jgi:hypothetical protein
MGATLAAIGEPVGRQLHIAQRAMEKLAGKLELTPTSNGRKRYLVAKLELTGERLELLAQEAAKNKGQQKQQAIKMVAGVGFEPTTFGL